MEAVHGRQSGRRGVLRESHAEARATGPPLHWAMHGQAPAGAGCRGRSQRQHQKLHVPVLRPNTYVCEKWECAHDCSDCRRKQRRRSFATRTVVRMVSAEKSLWRIYETDIDAFDGNFGMDTFKQRYAEDRSGNGVNPFLNANHFNNDNYEWQRILQLPGGDSKRLLRCPEDAALGPGCKRAARALPQLPGSALPGLLVEVQERQV